MSAFAVCWIYKLDQDFIYNVRKYLPKDWGGGFEYYDKKNRLRMIIDVSGNLKVFAGYRWDGCTPKFSIFDILIGIPDGVPNVKTDRPKTYYASLAHDVLYQFLDVNADVLPKRKADYIFLELLARDNFAPRYVYWFFVWVFGRGSHAITRWKRKYQSRRVPL